MFLHLTLVPFLGHAGELKTKPTQHSVQELRRIGIQPDMVMCRSEEPLARDIREKIALFVNLPVDSVVSARDVDNIYKVPLYFRAEGVDDQILDRFGIETEAPDLSGWEGLVKRGDEAARERPDRPGGQVHPARGRLPVGDRGAQPRRHPPRRQGRGALDRVRTRWPTSVGRGAGAVRRHPDPRRLRRAAASRARSAPPATRARTACPTWASAWACRSRSPSSRATWPAWTAPTPPSSIPRPRTRSSTSCPSRRRCATWAAPCASAPTR